MATRGAGGAVVAGAETGREAGFAAGAGAGTGGAGRVPDADATGCGAGLVAGVPGIHAGCVPRCAVAGALAFARAAAALPADFFPDTTVSAGAGRAAFVDGAAVARAGAHGRV
ncbi:MAG TPA: hypothetical protein VI504_14010, partial [Candidatus Eisenbacteria bacterium]